jgi:poly-gamma-glutamate synthesis protein (capsule biosynthesis protein)
VFTAAPTTAPSTPITLAFGGDVHADGQARAALAEGALSPIEPALRNADITVVNLETAITTRGTPAHKDFTFRAPPVLLTRLRAVGVDVVTAANNHGRDYGAVGLQDTLAAEKATGMPIIGIGQNAAEAFTPFRKTVRGVRVAVIGATQVMDSSLAAEWTATDTHPGLASAQDPTRLLAAVRAARRTNDLVVVFLHWGTELVTCPTLRQRTLAGELERAGADVVVGSHAHRLLGAGAHGTTYVDYGLGNFIFSTQGAGATTGVLRLTVSQRKVTRQQCLPAVIRGGIPRLVSGSRATEQLRSWHKLRACTVLTAV